MLGALVEVLGKREIRGGKRAVPKRQVDQFMQDSDFFGQAFQSFASTLNLCVPATNLTVSGILQITHT